MPIVATAKDGGPSTRNGTSVLHYMVRNRLAATTNATDDFEGGSRLQYNAQGHSLKQTLDISLAGLSAGADYLLLSLSGDETNMVVADTFQADSKGRARISYSAKGSNGHGKGKGKGHQGLPEAIDPLTDLRAFSIADASTQQVAYAWIDASQSFQYLVKRNLTPASSAAAGSVSLIASENHVNFRLLVSGLDAGAGYHLALNSNVVSSVSADSNGRLQINDWPQSAPSILDLRLLQVLDVSSNAVLSTTLPK